MGDFSFRIKNDSDLFADLEISRGDFLVGNELETAVTISLFSDRRAEDDEYLRHAQQFQRPPLNRGYWPDSFRDTILGSGIWLLEREKRLPLTRIRAESYAKDALQWLVRDGICKSIDVTAQFDPSNEEVLLLDVVLTRQDDETITQQYSYVWDTINTNVAPELEVAAAGVNVNWRDETTNLVVGVYDPASFPIDDYGYVCDAATYNTAYAAELTSDTATNPTFLRQCNDGVTTWPPIAFAHLKGWPVKDLFDGDECSTGAISDTAWTIRGYVTTLVGGGASGPILSGESVNISAPAGDYAFIEMTKFPGGVEDLTSDVILDSVTGSPDGLSFVGTTYTINSINYEIGWLWTAGSKLLAVRKGGVIQWSVVSATTTVTARIVADGVNVSCFVNGTQRFTEANVNGITNYFSIVNVVNTDGSITASMDNILGLDGSSNFAYIDPTGEACV